MTKVYPKSPSCPDVNAIAVASAGGAAADCPSAALTVWRRSLLFNGKGFTVFDAAGNLVFRVESYGAAAAGEAVLMDAGGAPLLTVRRKKLSWQIYDGDVAGGGAAAPRFTVKRHVGLLSAKKALVELWPTACGRAGDGRCEVEGSYARRSCAVYKLAGGGGGRQKIAAVHRKEAAFGLDVFRLVVEPGMDAAVAMAIVILLDLMHAS